MQLKSANPNYSAEVVALKEFKELAGCDRVQATMINFSQIIVGKDAKVGDLGLYFPVECALSKELLSNNNLYRKAEYGNIDPTKTGYFESHGRIKCVKFRGHKSEGLFLPIDSLKYLGIPLEEFKVGMVFDKIDDHEICCKYIPKGNRRGMANPQRAKQAKLQDQIVDGQFRFHYDAENLRRNIHKIAPTDYISISNKVHGTSVVISNILVKRQLNWIERLLKKLNVSIQENTYGITYSSRKVIKAVNGVTKASNHYYTEDIWGVVAKEFEEKIPKGYTVYGEIIGYTSDGKMIQPGYHYGCRQGQHKFEAYRVTHTNHDGQVIELTWPQMKQFCAWYNIPMVEEYYYGTAFDLFPHLDVNNHWHESFLEEIEKCYMNDRMCPRNHGEVPEEGIVVRIDYLQESLALKLKNFLFLQKESAYLDSGEVDIETSQSDADAIEYTEIEYQEDEPNVKEKANV